MVEAMPIDVVNDVPAPHQVVIIVTGAVTAASYAFQLFVFQLGRGRNDHLLRDTFVCLARIHRIHSLHVAIYLEQKS